MGWPPRPFSTQATWEDGRRKESKKQSGRMAELVGEKIPAAAELRSRVYAREPMETRGVRQPITPPMSDAIREGRERDAGDAEEPKYP